GDTSIELRFSAPLAPVTTRSEPKLSPTTAGAWSQPTPTTLRFTPSGGYLPGTVVHITVPRGLAATDGASPRPPPPASFRGEDAPRVRLTQLLADLRSLPVHLSPPAHQPAPGDTTGQLRAIFHPPAGRLLLGADWPAELDQLWTHEPSVVLSGALMAFESQH